MTVTAHIRQGAKPHRSAILGQGSNTIGGAGCLLCAIREAQCILVPGTSRDPRELNDLGINAGAFVGSGAIIDKLAACAGLVCGPRIAGDTAVIRSVIMQALRAGSLALLHVDHDSKRANGDSAADHWVLAIALDADGIVYADPATGGPGSLPTETLIGMSTWPDKRVFAVRALRVLSLP